MTRRLQEISVQYVKGVGPARKKLFSQLGVDTIEDLLYFFPRRYEDRTQMTELAKIKIGETQTVCGEILSSEGRQTWFNRKHVYEALVGDQKNRIACVWFNQPYLDRYLHPGHRIVLFGKVEIYKNRLQMVSPEYEVINEGDEALSVGRIVPIYSLTKGMSQRYLRRTIKLCLDVYGRELRDVLPEKFLKNYRLLSLTQSILNIHFPDSLEAQENALKRISFEEFFFFQVSVTMRRMSMIEKPGFQHRIADDWLKSFEESFPFQLTGAQKKVIGEITVDLKKSSPMLRLLQGDVGSGKTVVAFLGCAAAVENGFQSAWMAPTEILARQHFNNLTALSKIEFFKNLRIGLLVSSLKKEEKEEVLRKTREGEMDLLIGTHALLEKEVQFKHLSFTVIDEQHKFGIRQRSLLSDKGKNPDVLIMTATPIPRTLCLTLYGDLDVSILDESPPGRGKVTTKAFQIERSNEVYTKIKQWVNEGQQAFIVYPLVQESEKLDLKAAVERFAHFQKNEFKDLPLGLVHGQMKRSESQETMQKFKDKTIKVLVATTVVEVGIDVPNATIMVIEHAERFGLAQLHQLRGRIGRGAKESYCILIADPTNEEAKARLKAMLSTTDGFKIAEMDLLIRGPGQFFGRHQHGLNELKVANPVTQLDILELARKEAVALTAADPKLEQKENFVVKETIRKRYPTYLNMAAAG